MKGTLLGFTFNNIHSSELGLTMVSDGSGFNQNLLPDFENKVVDKPGSDGQYYYGTVYNNNNITINVAFDSLTELQLRTIKQLFGSAPINYLVFDEMPFKQYKVKLGSTPQISYNAFTSQYQDINSYIAHNHHLNTSILPAHKALDKVLKGTMTLNFIAYEPFAFNRTIELNNEKIKLRYSDQFLDKAYVPEWRKDSSGGTSQSNVDYNIYNYLEWKDSVDFISSATTTTQSSITYTLDVPQSSGVLVYNPGDFDSPFNLTFKFSAAGADVKGLNILYASGTSLGFKDFKLSNTEDAFRINEKLQLIEGINTNGSLSGRLYNKYINTGAFFNIPADSTQHLIRFSWGSGSTALAATNPISIDYDYKFY